MPGETCARGGSVLSGGTVAGPGPARAAPLLRLHALVQARKLRAVAVVVAVAVGVQAGRWRIRILSAQRIRCALRAV